MPQQTRESRENIKGRYLGSLREKERAQIDLCKKIVKYLKDLCDQLSIPGLTKECIEKILKAVDDLHSKWDIITADIEAINAKILSGGNEDHEPQIKSVSQPMIGLEKEPPRDASQDSKEGAKEQELKPKDKKENPQEEMIQPKNPDPAEEMKVQAREVEAKVRESFEEIKAAKREVKAASVEVQNNKSVEMASVKAEEKIKSAEVSIAKVPEIKFVEVSNLAKREPVAVVSKEVAVKAPVVKSSNPVAKISQQEEMKVKPKIWASIVQRFSNRQVVNAKEKIKLDIAKVESGKRDVGVNKEQYIATKQKKLEAYRRLVRMRNYKQQKEAVQKYADKSVPLKFTKNVGQENNSKQVNYEKGKQAAVALAPASTVKKYKINKMLWRLRASKRLMRMNKKKASREKLPELRGLVQNPQAAQVKTEQGRQSKVHVLKRGTLRSANQARLKNVIKMTPRMNVKTGNGVKGGGKVVKMNPQVGGKGRSGRSGGGNVVSMMSVGRGARSA